MATETDWRKSSTLPIDIIVSPFRRFARTEAAGSILLLLSTVVALVWANSPWEDSYHAIWNAEVSVRLGRFVLSESRHHWVNDGLMSIFFFLVGLEIKREILVGELSSFRQAAFPLIAAIGGTVIPSVLYLVFAAGVLFGRGWGIPMATDIAFALGVLLLLGKRIPASLRIFIAALAIVDDILAVLVIAVFYTANIHFFSLIVAAVGVVLSLTANFLGVRRPIIYAFIGAGIWVAVLKSGVHATVAGVLLAFTIPAQTHLDRDHFAKRVRELVDYFVRATPGSFDEHSTVSTLAAQCEMVQSPLHRIEHGLSPWVSLVIMPIFAFANAGVHVLGKGAQAVSHPVTLGVAAGLFLGKPTGVCLFAWLSARLNWANRPLDITWKQIFGASWLCGIGFTMSLFIANLAFGEGDLLTMAKIGTLVASLAAGICGSFVLRAAKVPDTGE